MTAFHWVFFGFLLVVLVALALSRRSGPTDDDVKAFRCSICGDGYEEAELVEREFTSGYAHAICGRCAASLYDEARGRGLAEVDGEGDARA